MAPLREVSYNREAAVAYANEWAYKRNPRYLDFANIGGDCTNFASQCIFAGSGVMNFTPVYGWYYLSANNRTASWTGVEYLYNFLTGNKGRGPYAYETNMTGVIPGDIAQLAFNPKVFGHSPVITEIRGEPTLDNIYIAAHDVNVNCRPLSTYSYERIRFLHINGVRRE